MSPPRYSPQRFAVAAPPRYSPQRFAVAAPAHQQMRCSPQRYAATEVVTDEMKREWARAILNSGVKLFFAEWCGHCKNMVSDLETALAGDVAALKKLHADVLVNGEGKNTSDGEPVTAFPTIQHADGKVTQGYPGLQNLFNEIKTHSKKGMQSIADNADNADDADLTDVEKIDEMVKAGVKAFTKEYCGWCKKLKALHKNMAKLCVEAQDGEKGSDGKSITGFPTLDFGDGNIHAGYMDGVDKIYKKYKASRSTANKRSKK